MTTLVVVINCCASRCLHVDEFAGKVITSCNSQLVQATAAMHLVLCCDPFDHGSSQVKCEPLDLVMEGHEVSLQVGI